MTRLISKAELIGFIGGLHVQCKRQRKFKQITLKCLASAFDKMELLFTVMGNTWIEADLRETIKFGLKFKMSVSYPRGVWR